MLLRVPSDDGIARELVRNMNSLDLLNQKLWGRGPETVLNALQVIMMHTDLCKWMS